MRVYFGPCGIALGHAGRCIPIAKALRSSGNGVFFSTYGEAVEFVRKASFPVGEAPPIKVFEKVDGEFDFRRTLSAGPKNLYQFALQIGAEISLIERFKPDVVVSDSRLSTVLAARMIRIPSVLLLHQLRIMIPHRRPIKKRYKLRIKSNVERLGLEILGSLWKRSKVIIVPDLPPPYTIAKANVVPSYQYLKKVKLVGPIIPKHPEELPEQAEIKRALGFDDRPLIFAAISGTKAEKLMITKTMAEIFREFPDRYNIVLSRGISDSPCPEIRTNGGRLRIYNWVDDRYAYLKACDLLVTRGGHNTVGESIYYGKPMVVIPTIAHSEHQGIAESVEKMKIGKRIQQYDLNRASLLAAVEEILESGDYSKRILEAQRFAKNYDAIESICRTIRVVASGGSL
ncbi:MAG: glycosyltransferase [Candidatus Verstraetearchaeota archaeon]|nr:glycosyltransferase [Candidatus Verstraetearchaeota archaeon]